MLYLTSLYHFILFHSLAEMACVTVAVALFMIAWNTRRFANSSFLLLIGIAYFFVGVLDLLHALAYKGMGVFQGYDANLPTQLWIAGRGLESLSVLAASLVRGARIRAEWIVPLYAGITGLLIFTVFAGMFPECYVEGTGLTPFKIGAEYVICLLLVVSAGILFHRRPAFEPDMLRCIMLSIGLTILSELAFTRYLSVYGQANLLGHLLKLVSYYCIYLAIIQTGLTKPYGSLFRELSRNREELQREKEHLQRSLAEVKELKGLLPICSHCKKIRDDSGYWNRLETYIEHHTRASFSHGLCHDCLDRLYPADEDGRTAPGPSPEDP